MKALIISEDENVYSVLNSVLQKAGYDTIIYKWLLKALDNIEEIRPDCIVVSSSEYPRHWKTLVQFVKSGIGGDEVEVYLYEPNPMSSEDEEKARILGITDYFTSLEPSVLEGIFASVKTEAPVVEAVSEAVAEQPVEEKEEIPTVENIIADEPEKEEEKNEGHYMFTHPYSGKYVTGKFFEYNGTTLSCVINNLNGITKNCNIEYFTFFDSKKTRTAKVCVKDIVNVTVGNTL
ncbi:MAG: hypothetical protein IKR45_04940, partial [Treponema sp.]|nr:hypothetical protein [Treponema sp.]